MTWWLFLLVFAIACVRIYARAAQQLNVQNNLRRRVPAFSMLMSGADIALWSISAYAVFSQDWLGLLFMGLIYGVAGALGSLWAMHRHFDGNYSKTSNSSDGPQNYDNIRQVAREMGAGPREAVKLFDALKRASLIIIDNRRGVH